MWRQENRWTRTQVNTFLPISNLQLSGVVKPMLEVRQVVTGREKEIFLTFPWKIYRHDPLWVPPILSERRKATDPSRGLFFQNGYADFFIAWQGGQPVGTICCSHENTGD